VKHPYLHADNLSLLVKDDEAGGAGSLVDGTNVLRRSRGGRACASGAGLLLLLRRQEGSRACSSSSSSSSAHAEASAVNRDEPRGDHRDLFVEDNEV